MVRTSFHQICAKSRAGAVNSDVGHLVSTSCGIPSQDQQGLIMSSNNKVSPTIEALIEEILSTIRNIPTQPLAPDTVFLLGVADVVPILESWDKLESGFASAKLAIVRDEFSARFPMMSNETEGFTFGLRNPDSDRYMTFLKPREPSDITNLVIRLIDDVYPPTGFLRKRRIQGFVPLVVKLTKVLTAYSQRIESTLHPYAKAFGINTGE